MAAGITGIDNLKTWLQNCTNPSRIDIYLGSKPAGGVFMSCCRDKGDLIDQVENIFCNYDSVDNILYPDFWEKKGQKDLIGNDPQPHTHNFPMSHRLM